MKVQNQTAVEVKKNKIPFSIRHITTFGINDSRVTGVIRCHQGDKIHCDYGQFSRLSPLVAPTFGNFKVETHAFWIPLRNIWKHYGDYISNSKDASFSSVREPINFSLFDVIALFSLIDDDNEVLYTLVGSSEDYQTYEKIDTSDLSLVMADSNGTIRVFCYNFTDMGRMVWNTFQSLGYTLPTYIVRAPSIAQDSTFAHDDAFWQSADLQGANQFFQKKRFSLYPLLAMARCYFDWLFPKQYVVQQGWGYLFSDEIYSRLDQTPGAPYTRVHVVMYDIFNMVTTCYDSNFFTSLWQSPNEVTIGGNSGVGSSFNLSGTPYDASDPTKPTYMVGSNRNDNSVYRVLGFGGESLDYGIRTLSDRALSWLTHVSDYVLRNNIGGQRVQDYFKSHFGFVPSDIRSETSTWIDTFVDNVTIQDVTNMSTPLGEDGKPSVLGEQGGKGTSGGSNRLKFECKEKGYIIFITQIVPSVGYYQGIKEHAHAITNRFDLYHEDFDGVGMVGVAKDYLFASHRNFDDVMKVPLNVSDEVLGFAPNYATKKIGYDVLSGDFIFKSRNKGLDSYHTFRDVLYNRGSLAIDRQFFEADNQYQRIFAYTGEENEQGLYAQYDKIFSFISFNVDRFTSAKSLSESMPFFDDEGKRVGTEYQGEQL